MKKGTLILGLLAVSLAAAWAVSQPKSQHHSNRNARRPRRPQ